MWCPLVLNETNYLLKYIHQSDIKIYITDCKQIWSEELSQVGLIQRFQELNPLFDISLLTENELVERVLTLVHELNPSNSYTLTYQSANLVFELKCKQEVSIKFKFDFAPENDVAFFNQFTLPLMQSIQYLEMRQKKLVDQLEKKDKEIQEHVLENEALVTKKFDRNTVIDSVPQELLVNVFGKSKIFYESFAEKFGVIRYSQIKDESPRKKLKTAVDT